MIDFSIIIPAKNEEVNIAHCLDSINAVKYDQNRFEILVVDNGSVDRTVDVANEKGAKVYVQPDLTISGLRNFGARQASGKILAFLDADCTVSEDWLSAASLYIDRSDVAAFGSPAILPEITTWVQRAWFFIRAINSNVQEVDWHESANVFVHREYFETVNGFDESMVTCEDYDLSIKLKEVGKLLSDSRIRVIHHREPKTIMEFFNKERWRSSSNRARLVKGNFKLQEFPSLVLPILYFLLALTFVVYLFVFGIFDGSRINTPLVFLLLGWQIPLLLLSFWKIRRQFRIITGLQLYVLLNVYFMARGFTCMKMS
jgi:glycosyltransferase involved in cell wall biosynthesis